MDIHKIARKMIADHLVFQHTEEYHEWKLSGAPAWQSRRVTLGGRRRQGFTTATIKLALEFWPSLIIVPRIQHVRHVVDTAAHVAPQHFDNTGGGPNIKGVPFTDVVVSAERLEHHLMRRTPINYTLAIIDEAYMTEQQIGSNKMDELRDRLFQTCTLLVEFQ